MVWCQTHGGSTNSSRGASNQVYGGVLIKENKRIACNWLFWHPDWYESSSQVPYWQTGKNNNNDKNDNCNNICNALLSKIIINISVKKPNALE